MDKAGIVTIIVSKRAQNIPQNFKYINENVHGQLMRAFLNFNPVINLKNIKDTLAKADPEIKQYVHNLNDMIERHLKEVLDPCRFRKHYSRVVKEGIKSKEAKNMNHRHSIIEETAEINSEGIHSSDKNLTVNKFIVKANKPVIASDKKKARKLGKEKQDCKFIINISGKFEGLHYSYLQLFEGGKYRKIY